MNFLARVPRSYVGHYVGRLFATKLAVRALESWRLAALVLVVPGHVPLDGEATAAFRARERLSEAIREITLRVRAPLPTSLRVIIRQGRHVTASEIWLARRRRRRRRCRRRRRRCRRRLPVTASFRVLERLARL